MGNYSMPGYFQNMPVIGKALRKVDANNEAVLKQIEAELKEFTEKSLANGTSDEKMNAKGQLTAMQRIALLVDPGTWCPLNSIYNPCDNKTGTDTIIKGLGRINGKWAVIIASDNKKHAGTWVPGQADDLLRGSDTAKRLRIPLVYVLNCAGVELDKQEQVYPTIGAQCGVIDRDVVAVPRLMPWCSGSLLNRCFQLLHDFLCDDFIYLAAHFDFSLSFSVPFRVLIDSTQTGRRISEKDALQKETRNPA